MAGVNNETTEEPPLPAKRKPELECIDDDDDRKKKRPDISDNDIPAVEEKSDKIETNVEAEAENIEGDEDEEDEDDEDGEEEEEDEHSNRKSVADTKGKGIMKVDKGKGKLEAEDGSDDDDDDSSDGGDHSNDDSDLSDDPLAEVDLDNILPSRTRRRVAEPGAYLVNDLDEDDDSDDSDA